MKRKIRHSENSSVLMKPKKIVTSWTNSKSDALKQIMKIIKMIILKPLIQCTLPRLENQSHTHAESPLISVVHNIGC